MDLPRSQGFFDVPVDDLFAMPTLCRTAIAAKVFPTSWSMTPDAGFAKRRPAPTRSASVFLTIADKERTDHFETGRDCSISSVM